MVSRAERVVDVFFVLAWLFQAVVLVQYFGIDDMPDWQVTTLAVLLVAVGVAWVWMRVVPDTTRPDPYAVVGLVALAYAVFGDGVWPMALVLVVLIAVAGARGMGWAVAFVVAFLVIVVATMALAYHRSWMFILIQVAAMAVVFAVELTIVGLIRRVDIAIRANGRLLAELEQAHAELAASVETEKELAVSQARTRSARDLHDGLGHRLAVGGYSLEFALRMRDKDPEAAWSQVAEARGTMADAMRELRSWVRVLAPGDAVDPGEPLGLIARSFEGSGLDVTVEAPPLAAPLSTEVADIVHRVAQEGVTNAIKHAPGAPVRVSLAVEDDTLVVEVTDDGPGAPADTSEGFGLRNLRERVELSGGTLSTSSPTHGGHRLTARLPYEFHATPGGQP